MNNIPRYFGRYGITHDIFERESDRCEKPDVILVISKMDHWCPGPHEVIGRVKPRYPDVPVVLGGTYATRC